MFSNRTDKLSTLTSNVTSTPTHVYLDATFYNNSQYLDNPSYIPAQIYETRTTPILTCPSEWEMAIARFSITADYTARAAQATGTTGSSTWYYVGLSYNGTYYDVPIVIPTTIDLIGNPTKLEYNINSFINLINDGYLQAQTLATGAGLTATFGQVCMTYDSTNGGYYMNIPSWAQAGSGATGSFGSTGNGVGVHMSFLLYQKFNSFNTNTLYPILQTNHDISFNKVWNGNNQIPATDIYMGTQVPQGTGGNYYFQLPQDAFYPSSIMDISRLLISTNTMPVNVENKSTTFYDNNQLANSPGNQIIPILTDFLIGKDAPLTGRAEPYVYIPDMYRFASMIGSNPMSIWDINVSIVSNNGTIYQLYLPPNGYIDLKLVFVKKSANFS